MGWDSFRFSKAVERDTGSDGEQPGLEFWAFERMCLFVNTPESLLKKVLGKVSVAAESRQIRQDIGPVSAQYPAERVGVAAAMGLNQAFVATVCQSISLHLTV